MSQTAIRSAIDPNASYEKESARQLEEWKQARDVLKSFDDHLHDLRKYGFSFLTALFATESILARSSDARSLDPQVKFAVFAVTLLLIAAVHLFDKNYRIYQEAANTRALVLERKLNLELSEDVSVRHRKNRVNLIVATVYVMFIVGVLLLGSFVLEGEQGWIIGLVVFGTVIGVVPIFTLGLHYAYKEGEDWTISPLECARGELVKITLNNLTSKTRVIKQNGERLDFSEKLTLFFVRFFEENKGDATEIIWGSSADRTKIVGKSGQELDVRARLVLFFIRLLEAPVKMNLAGIAKSVSTPEPIVFGENEPIWEIKDEVGGKAGHGCSRKPLEVYYAQTWIWATSDKKEGVYQFYVRDSLVPLFTIIVSDSPSSVRRNHRLTPMMVRSASQRRRERMSPVGPSVRHARLSGSARIGGTGHRKWR
jgi:hypothetical protein